MACSILLVMRFMVFPGAMDLTVDLLWAASCCMAWAASPRIVIAGILSVDIIASLLVGPIANPDVFGAKAWIIELVALTGMLISVAVTQRLRRAAPIRLGIGLIMLATLFAAAGLAYRCDNARPFLGVYLAGTGIILFLTATHARRSPIVWSLLAGWGAGYVPFCLLVWIFDLDRNASGSLCQYAQRYLLIPVSIHFLGLLVGVALIRHLGWIQTEDPPSAMSPDQ